MKVTVEPSGAVGMQTMDADLARLVRNGEITRSLAEQRASVPEELKRLLGGAMADPAAPEANGTAAQQPPTASAPPPAYAQGG